MAIASYQQSRLYSIFSWQDFWVPAPVSSIHHRFWGINIIIQKFTMAARFEFPNPPHTRPCRLERVHTPTAHLFRKCSNGAFCTSKQRISPRRNDRVRPHTRGGRPHRSGARPTARPQQQQQHQQPQHQQQTAAQQQHYKFAELRLNFGVGVLQRAAGAGGR